jgi:hypothetical protein
MEDYMMKNFLLILMIILSVNLFAIDSTFIVNNTNLTMDTTSTVVNSISTSLFSNINSTNVISIIITVIMAVLFLIFKDKYYKKKQIITEILETLSETIKDNKVTSE